MDSNKPRLNQGPNPPAFPKFSKIINNNFKEASALKSIRDLEIALPEFKDENFKIQSQSNIPDQNPRLAEPVNQNHHQTHNPERSINPLENRWQMSGPAGGGAAGGTGSSGGCDTAVNNGV